MDKQTFNNIVESYPHLSSYICFARLVKGKGYDRRKVNRLMNQLVDKSDYDSGNKSLLIDQLTEYSKITPK